MAKKKAAAAATPVTEAAQTTTTSVGEAVAAPETIALAPVAADSNVLYSSPLPVFGYDPETIVLDKRFMARNPESVKKAKLDAMVDSMMTLREQGKPHQLQPGIVTVIDDVVYLVAGQYRLLAERKLNELAPEEPFLFFAQPMPSADFITSVVENEVRDDPDFFSKAETMQRLIDAGKSQDEIATIYRIKRGYVSDHLSCAKLPKKVQAMYPVKITKEGLIALSRCYTAVETKKITKAEFDSAVDELETIYDSQEAAIGLVDDITAGKVAAAAPEEAGEETPNEAPAPKPKVKKSDAVTSKKKAPTAKRIGAKEVKKKASSIGAKKDSKTYRNRTDLVTFLNGNFGSEAKDIAEPMSDLAEKLEAWFDGAISDLQLRNQWVKSCRQKYAN